MKKFKEILMSLAIVGAIVTGTAAVTATTAEASPASKEIQSGANTTGQKGGKSFQQNIKTFINVVLYVLGALAVIMIVIGGLRYTVSAGDSSATTGAKNTILYAVVGLIVALLAYAIVNFVLTQFT